jgi:SAM-dependent methyltransferase
VDDRRTAKRAGGLIRHPARVGPAVRRRLRPPRPRPPRQPPRFDIITGPLNLSGRGLEIGASWRPILPKAKGYDVRVADHLDQAGLVAKYDGLRPTDAIETVDYVLTGRGLADAIDERFDWIVGSHVLEHTVCLVTFLRDAETLLGPGGILSLAVPDRRYCLDRFRDRTSLGRVIDVFRASPAVHSEGSILEFYLSVVTKGGAISWDATESGAFRQHHTLEEARKKAAIAAAEYVDVHNWVFTPNHLRLMLVDLRTLGFIGLREVAFHETVGSEFYIALSADGPGPPLSRVELIRLAALEVQGNEEIDFAASQFDDVETSSPGGRGGVPADRTGPSDDLQ